MGTGFSFGVIKMFWDLRDVGLQNTGKVLNVTDLL